MIINLENGKLRLYSFEISDKCKLQKILGEIAIKGGIKTVVAHDTNWYSKDEDFDNKIQIEVNNQKYTTITDIIGNEEEIIVDYKKNATGNHKVFGRDEYEKMAYEYDESYTKYKVPDLYKKIGMIYYNNIIKMKDSTQIISLIDFYQLMNENLEKQYITKKQTLKDDLIHNILDDEYEDIKDKIDELKNATTSLELLKIYKPEIEELIHLNEYENKFIDDLNTYYEYVKNNESTVISKDKLFKEYNVKEYDLNSIPKKILKKECN